MKFFAWAMAAAFLFMSTVSAPAAEAGRITVKTPGGTEQSFLFAAPNQPKAAAILFVGGTGILGLTKSGRITKNKQNFLVRAYKEFLNNGIMVSIVDVPAGKMISAKFRISKRHANDMVSVIKFMKRKADVPVWMIGTSMGTFSAASVAIKKQKLVAGLVLTSTVTRSDEDHKLTRGFPDGVAGLNLQKNLRMPVLILAHKHDGCKVSPPAGSEKLKKKTSRTPRAEVVMLIGGKSAKSGACEALSEHGFYGIEREAVDRIADFIAR